MALRSPRGRDLDAQVREVLRRDACSGCGACALLDPGIAMELDVAGFMRPVRRTPSALDDAAQSDAVRAFRRACPGVEVQAARPEGAERHPTMGPVVAAYEAWAADPEIRFRGSSGGALTALTAWLATTGEVHEVIGSGPQPGAPSRTVPLRLTTREEALASAGSRYGPTATLASHPGSGPGTAVVGKPCEISAMRALTQRPDADGPGPLLLSFFCAGTPSQRATDGLVAALGMPDDEPLESLRYRGHGWPGRFTARSVAGTEVSASYDESWGKHLGPAVQWRCKICPDGVGEQADITAADFWRTDERGYPDFTDGAGISALLARTRRGAEVVERAVAAGVLVVGPLDLADLARVQPLQRRRRTTLLGRLLGARSAGRRSPRFRGFGLLRLALSDPRDTVRTARGTRARVRARRTP